MKQYTNLPIICINDQNIYNNYPLSKYYTHIIIKPTEVLIVLSLSEVSENYGVMFPNPIFNQYNINLYIKYAKNDLTI